MKHRAGDKHCNTDGLSRQCSDIDKVEGPCIYKENDTPVVGYTIRCNLGESQVKDEGGVGIVYQHIQQNKELVGDLIVVCLSHRGYQRTKRAQVIPRSIILGVRCLKEPNRSV